MDAPGSSSPPPVYACPCLNVKITLQSRPSYIAPIPLDDSQSGKIQSGEAGQEEASRVWVGDDGITIVSPISLQQLPFLRF